jgi:hypothetical protein
MKRTPYMVENQCGASDIPQSMAAKVVVRERTTRPAAETPRSLAARPGSWASSCRRDQELTCHARRDQAATYAAARTAKNGRFR